MHPTEPLVSVIIVSYHRPYYLRHRSIPSVLDQTLTDWELIIVGDGPPDTQVRNVVSSFADSRIRYDAIERPDYGDSSKKSFWNRAGAEARNHGLKLARGRYIAPLDDDDKFTSNHLSESVAALERNGWDLVYGSTIVRDYEMGTERVDYIPWERSEAEDLFPARNVMYHSNVVYRSDFRELSYPTSGNIAGDWGLWRKLYAAGARFGSIEEPQSVYYAPSGHPKVRVNIPHVPSVEEYTLPLKHIFATRMLSNHGPYAIEFEQWIQQYLGGVEIASTSSGDAGLIVSIQAVRQVMPANQIEVILPSYTFPSTVNAVLWNGCKPVFADISADHLCLSAATIEPHITSKTLCILPVHSHGAPPDVDVISRLAEAHSLPVVWDAAGAFGSYYKGSPVGTGGTGLFVFSFSGTKAISTGEGGAIAIEDERFREAILSARNYGFREDYNCKTMGINAKMSELHAAMGILALPQADQLIAWRQRVARRYKDNLDGIDDVRFQGSSHPSARSNFKDLTLIFDTHEMREGVRRVLAGHGIQTKLYYRPAHRMPLLKDVDHGDLTVTERIAERGLCVPIFHVMRPKLVDDICAMIRNQVTGSWA